MSQFFDLRRKVEVDFYSATKLCRNNGMAFTDRLRLSEFEHAAKNKDLGMQWSTTNSTNFHKLGITLPTMTKKIGILYGKERSFPEALIKCINDKKINGIAAEPELAGRASKAAAGHGRLFAAGQAAEPQDARGRTAPDGRCQSSAQGPARLLLGADAPDRFVPHQSLLGRHHRQADQPAGVQQPV
ncbi:MAG: hypothetical protein EBT84_12345 [Sphingomonadaceae bacterium]|nr:hypothetical protein [Sphingomonadaceae bacterium]